MAAKAALKTTADSPDETDFEAAALQKLGVIDFYIQPRLSVQIDAHGSVTLLPFDASLPSKGLMGCSLAITIVPGPVPGYRLENAKALDLRYLLAKHVQPTLEQDAERLTKITIADLERALDKSEKENLQLRIAVASRPL